MGVGGERSGHSSVSFTGMMMVTLYLSGKMGVFNKRGGYFFKYLIAISPLALAVFVAISRTRDCLRFLPILRIEQKENSH